MALALCGGAGTLEQEECRESTGLRTWARNEITLSADYHAKDVKSVAGLNDGEGQPPPPLIGPRVAMFTWHRCLPFTSLTPLRPS